MIIILATFTSLAVSMDFFDPHKNLSVFLDNFSWVFQTYVFIVAKYIIEQYTLVLINKADHNAHFFFDLQNQINVIDSYHPCEFNWKVSLSQRRACSHIMRKPGQIVEIANTHHNILPQIFWCPKTLLLQYVYFLTPHLISTLKLSKYNILLVQIVATVMSE